MGMWASSEAMAPGRSRTAAPPTTASGRMHTANEREAGFAGLEVRQSAVADCSTCVLPDALMPARCRRAWVAAWWDCAGSCVGQATGDGVRAGGSAPWLILTRVEQATASQRAGSTLWPAATARSSGVHTTPDDHAVTVPIPSQP